MAFNSTHEDSACIYVYAYYLEPLSVKSTCRGALTKRAQSNS